LRKDSKKPRHLSSLLIRKLKNCKYAAIKVEAELTNRI
jgi:hypothetical protein